MWEGLDDAKVAVIAPSIDAFNAKNQELEEAQVHAILAAAGIVDGGDGEPTFKRGDGSEARVESQAKIYEDVRLTPADPVVLQVSRWDHLKDPEGVIRGFAEHASAHETGAHLIYAGPAVEAVSDDPEGAQVLAGGDRAARVAERRGAAQRPPRVPADGRRRGERGDRQRAPAQRLRRRAEEHRRGLRPDRRGGDVEGAADRRHRGRRHPGPGRRRRDRRAAGRRPRPRRLRRRRARAARGPRAREADGRGGQAARARPVPRRAQPDRLPRR